MHELSIAHAVVEAVTEAAEGRPVAAVRVRVGGLSAVVPDALRFAFDVATQGTCCEGATLEIDEVPVTVWCDACQATGSLVPPLRFRCPTCGAPTGDVRGGQELEIVSFTPAVESEV